MAIIYATRKDDDGEGGEEMEMVSERNEQTGPRSFNGVSSHSPNFRSPRFTNTNKTKKTLCNFHYEPCSCKREPANTQSSLEKLMEEHIHCEVNGTDKNVLHEKSRATINELFVWPWKGVVANIPVHWVNGQSQSCSKLLDELTEQGFNPVRVHPLWNCKSHSGFAIVEFKNDWNGLSDALGIEKAYEMGRPAVLLGGP